MPPQGLSGTGAAAENRKNIIARARELSELEQKGNLPQAALDADYDMGGQFAMASALTGWTTIDSLMLFFVYFYFGIAFSARLQAFARRAAERPAAALAALTAWAVAEALAVRLGLPEAPGLTLVFGLAGALAVIAAAALLARVGRWRWLAYCGRHSLTIYLSFFLPMAATRMLLLKTGWIADVGLMLAVITGAAITGPLALRALIRGTPLAFLYERPTWARLGDRPAQTTRRAERRQATGFAA